MIVTSLPRSGSTKYCIDLAKERGIKFVDEPFEYDLDPRHKHTIHETASEFNGIQPKDPYSVYLTLWNDAVINNHEISYFTLMNSHTFLSRQNVQDSVWSYIAYVDKYLQLQTGRYSEDMISVLLSKYLKKVCYFHEFIDAFNKILVIPQLEYTDSQIFRDQYSQFKPRVEKIRDQLLPFLPKGIVYE